MREGERELSGSRWRGSPQRARGGGSRPGRGGREAVEPERRTAKEESFPCPPAPSPPALAGRPRCCARTAAPREPAAGSRAPPALSPLRSQLVSVSRRRRDRSKNGHLRDQLWAGVRRGDGKGPACHPCSPFLGFITVASELTVIKADYEA